MSTLTLVALVSAVLAVMLLLRGRLRRNEIVVARESTPALDGWIDEALEIELADGALGMRASTAEERRKLGRSLRGDPDPEVVAKIEEKVKAVELEFVKYLHDADAEVTLRVRYEDGNAGTSTRRFGWADLPEAVRADFERRGGTRVFRAWVFPWARARAL
jgi:hypothetical protein